MIVVIELDVAKKGSKYWYRNGQRHRNNDQPAIIYSDGLKRWYKYGNYYIR